MTTAKWDGSDEQFWDAVAIANDPTVDESEAIAAAFVLQEALTLAQDALTRPDVAESDEGDDGYAETTIQHVETIPAPAARASVVVPARIVKRAAPGDIVTAQRAVELFSEHWVLRPVAPDKTSSLSEMRDYRVHDQSLEYNTSYPPAWQPSAGAIMDCPQWYAVCQQQPEAPVRAESGPVRISR